MYIDEPLYIDDIISISQISGIISCVRFDKEIVTIRFYDRNEKQIIINREGEEIVECAISSLGNKKAIVYIYGKLDIIIMSYSTSLISAELIKSYYDSYNEYLVKVVFVEAREKQLAIKEKIRNQIEARIQNQIEEERKRRLAIEDEIRNQIEKKKQTQIEEEKKAIYYEEIKRNVNIQDIDKMTGFEFENFIAYLFKKRGYKVDVTKRSNDQGIDIIVQDKFVKIGIQAKCYSSSVGNKAIQEAVAGKNIYKCDKVLVITNNLFTKSAIELAKCNHVGILDRGELIEMINRDNR